MRKLGLTVIGLTAMLAGCGSTPANTPTSYQPEHPQTQDNNQTETSTDHTSVDPKLIFWKTVDATGNQQTIAVAKDSQTGCEYIEFDGKTVTPRLDHDGKPMCNTGN